MLVKNAEGWLASLAGLRNEIYNDSAQTLEVRLTDLGLFPLPEEALPQLSIEKEIESQVFRVPEILQKSQIPIYYGQDGRVFVPQVSLSICRYFSQVWQPEAARHSEDFEICNGLLIIDSFVGGRL